MYKQFRYCARFINKYCVSVYNYIKYALICRVRRVPFYVMNLRENKIIFSHYKILYIKKNIIIIIIH